MSIEYSDKFADYSIVVEGREFRAHRFMMLRVPVFASMLAQESASYSLHLNVPGGASTFERCLRFIYNNKSPFVLEGAFLLDLVNLVAAFDFLDLEDGIKFAVLHLSRLFAVSGPADVVKALLMIESFNVVPLKDVGEAEKKMVAQSFEDYMGEPSFLSLPSKCVFDIAGMISKEQRPKFMAWYLQQVPASALPSVLSSLAGAAESLGSLTGHEILSVVVC